jgi:hypothetical protein
MEYKILIMLMKQLNIIVLFIAGIFLLACEKDLDLNLPSTSSKMVVEGWIENGQPAQIILSHSAPYFSRIDSTTLMQFAETHAKVSIYSDSESEILTLKPNESYFPPYIYNSMEIRGESGQSYTIEIVSGRDTITATTIIPDPVELDSIWFETDPGMNTRGRLWVRLSDDGTKTNYYRLLYKRKGKDTRYTPTNVSTFSDVMINGKTAEMGFLRGFSSLISIEEENYFETGDTISVKFCTIDAVQFNFWNVYQAMVLASANPLATSNNQLQSNIEGGLGIWTGYGATYYLVYAK